MRREIARTSSARRIFLDVAEDMAAGAKPVAATGEKVQHSVKGQACDSFKPVDFFV
jgi:hypothetical protein